MHNSRSPALRVHNCFGVMLNCEVVRVEQTAHSLTLYFKILTQDRDCNLRVAGEEWLVKKIGAYLPGAYEEVVDVVNAYVLTEKVS